MCVYVHVRVWSVCMCPRKPEEDFRYPGVRIIVSCEPPNVSARNRTQVCTLFTIEPSPQPPVCEC